MATCIWKGHAPPVAQVDRAAIDTGTTWANNDTVTFTINSKTVTHTLTTEANNHATILTNAAVTLNASTIPEFAEITWANYGDTHIQGTVDTAGKPVTHGTVTNTTAGDGAFGQFANVTANSGPYCADTAVNWSTGATPANTNDIIFENSKVPCKYGLDFSTIQPNSITKRQSFTGEIGLPRMNVDAGDDADNRYVEYREQSLKFAGTAAQETATSVDIGEGEGTGSGRVKIDMTTANTNFTIHNKGQRAETGIPCVLLKGTNTLNTLKIIKGDVGVAFFGGDTSNLSGGIDIGYKDSVLGDSELVCGSGVTLGNIDQTGGKTDFDLTTAAVTTADLRAGELTLRGDTNGITTFNVTGGKCIDMGGSGTIATLNVSGPGDYDHTKSMTARTITNVELFKGAAYRDPHGVVTETNDIDLNQCKLSDVTIEKPAHKTVAFSAV